MRDKILYRTIVHEPGCSFSYEPNTGLTVPWHCHADYELIYFTAGSGQEFVGDAVQRYRSGEMVLIGSGVPHLHLCDAVSNHAVQRTVCDILQFSPDIFPSDMGKIDEYSNIAAVLGKSARGVKFHDKRVVDAVADMAAAIPTETGVGRLVVLMRMLDMLGRSDDISFISSVSGTVNVAAYPSGDPVGRVYAYFMDHFREKFVLDDVARYAGMTPAALCRSFKAGTGMTMADCLNGIRVEHACRLLAHSEITVSQAAYEAGFNNMSHFNRQFLRITGQTPSDYRKHIRMHVE